MTRPCWEPRCLACGQPASIELVLDTHQGRAVRVADLCTGCWLTRFVQIDGTYSAPDLTWPGHEHHERTAA